MISITRLPTRFLPIKMATSEQLRSIGERLYNKENSLTDRFRALFTLRNLGGHEAIDWISKTFDDKSALLKHELAYCLGQMQDAYAIPVLIGVLEDQHEDGMVRHEAGEALGAIGSSEALEILEKYMKDPVVEVAETCQLAVSRIKWFSEKDGKDDAEKPFASVDPAPPLKEDSIEKLRDILLDESKPLFERYQAMFSLRDTKSGKAALVLAEGLKCSSSLFRHEIAYVLGQMQQEEAVDALKIALSNAKESPMVRHECAEALGSIAKDECLKVLSRYLGDTESVVSESCKVALDMYEYETSNQFQYADALANATS